MWIFWRINFQSSSNALIRFVSWRTLSPPGQSLQRFPTVQKPAVSVRQQRRINVPLRRSWPLVRRRANLDVSNGASKNEAKTQIFPAFLSRYPQGSALAHRVRDVLRDRRRGDGRLGEPPRVLRRLQLLRRWSHEQITQVFIRSPRARRSHGAGAVCKRAIYR